MKCRLVISAICVVGVLLSFGCSKDQLTDSLLGTTWVPVHAVGKIDGTSYTITWDDDIDENGLLVVRYERDGETFEYQMSFDGYKFFKDGKEKVYATFSPATPGKMSASRFRYYIMDNRIYLEQASSSGNPWSSSQKEDDTGTRYVSSLLVEFSSNRMTFDGITYRKVE